MAVHAFAHAGIAFLGDEAGDIILLDEVIEIVVCAEDDAAAATAVAAAGTAFRDVGFAMERDAAFATVAGARVNFYFINEHLKLLKPGIKTANCLKWLKRLNFVVLNTQTKWKTQVGKQI
jgi:hypothetical protein